MRQRCANGRCRMHGGRSRSGTAHVRYRHGQATREAIAMRRYVAALVRDAREMVRLQPLVLAPAVRRVSKDNFRKAMHERTGGRVTPYDLRRAFSPRTRLVLLNSPPPISKRLVGVQRLNPPTIDATATELPDT